jgi:hypothetical protein
VLLVCCVKRIADLSLLWLVPRFGEKFTLIDANLFTLCEATSVGIDARIATENLYSTVGQPAIFQ